MQVLYLGRALRTKETLPDFLKWRRVTRHPLVFRRLTGSQRTPGFGASQIYKRKMFERRNKFIKCIREEEIQCLENDTITLELSGKSIVDKLSKD